MTDEPRATGRHRQRWAALWQPGDDTLIDALRRRRVLRAGLIQTVYVAAAVSLGLLLPAIKVGPTAHDDVVVSLLFGIAGGLISFIALVFSLLFLVVQYGNASVSPRLTLFRDDPFVWHIFGYFSGVFTFAIAAAMRVASAPHQPSIVVPIVTLLLILVAFGLARAIQMRALGQLQFSRIMEDIRRRGQLLLERLYHRPYSDDPVAPADGLDPVVAELRWARPTALIRQIDLPSLVAEATRRDALIELRVGPGDEARRGMVVAAVRAAHPVAEWHALEALTIGTDRTFDQDPLLPFRLLSDIANRALSSAINDPATAVQALGCVHDLLAVIVDRQLYLGAIEDRSGTPRVLLRFPEWERFVAEAIDEISHYGRNDPTVRRRIGELLDDLSLLAPPGRIAALDARRMTSLSVIR